MAGRIPVWPQALPVSARMRSPVVTIAPTATIRQAAATMTRSRLRHLPVVGSGRLVGIVTDRDLRQAMFAPVVQERLGVDDKAVDDTPVREVMTWAVVTVRPATDLREAARLMHEQKIGAVPVVEGERVVGILTESDVLAALQEVLRADVTTVRPLSASPSAEPYDYGFSDAEPADIEGDEDRPMNAGRILVPLDGSEAAEAALPVALDVAAKSGGQLIVIRAAEVRFERDPSPVDTALVQIREAEAYLKTVRERIGARGRRVSAFLWQGSPAAAIVKAVQQYQIDLIVMSTHGRTGREQEMFGSVAEAVLGGVKVPVMVVRPTGVIVRTPPGEAAPLPS